MPPETQTSTPRHASSTSGPIFGALIIIIVLVFGAFYFWDEHLKIQARNSPPPYIPSDAGTTPADAATTTSASTTTLN